MSRTAKTLALTEEERRQLTQIDERGSDWRERRRARTVLLLDKGAVDQRRSDRAENS